MPYCITLNNRVCLTYPVLIHDDGLCSTPNFLFLVDLSHCSLQFVVFV